MFHDPAIQPIGSKDCELYCCAYIAKLFGKELDIEELRKIRFEERRLLAWYLHGDLGLPGSSCDWRDDPMWANREGYKEWVLKHIEEGYIGFAIIHLIPEMGHCVALLNADEQGVLLADSVRGLVKDSWEKHLSFDKQYCPSRVDAWYKLK